MRAAVTRILLVFGLVLAFGVVAVSSPAAAADKSWPSKKKKHKKSHKASKPAKPAGTGAAPAQDDEEEDDADDNAATAAKAGGNDGEDAKPKPKAKAQAADDKAGDKDDEREASDEKKKDDDDDDEGGSTVVRHKAKQPVMEGEGGAPVALEVMAGPRAVHRTFDFNDPLADHNSMAARPYGYKLQLAPAPFVDLGFYPGAFASRGAAASFGLIARYEKIVGTQTQNVDGSTFDTLAQQFEVGVRGRMPLGENEVGVTASYGKHTFHVAEKDPGPALGSTVPNVDYTFAGLDLDGRLRLSPIELGAHVGTRFVMKTGDLASVWFSTTKTTSIDAGLSVAYRLTPLFSLVGGVDLLRYAFDFNPVNAGNYIVAGGAVDQYISGFVALRVSLDGS
ncbi:MAG TPA: hypothetical protein VHL80_09995 [Polyangia bacterium]|nr:hypothetical protein [Polyangia bacterium]